MTMHLERGLTTTSYKLRKEKITKAMQAEFERGWRERNQRLKQMGLSKETFEQYMDWVHGRGKKEKEKKNTGQTVTKTSTGLCKAASQISKEAEKKNIDAPRKTWVVGAVSSPAPKIYTGTKIIGIATMHKSNAVPVFSDEEAIDIARMRR